MQEESAHFEGCVSDVDGIIQVQPAKKELQVADSDSLFLNATRYFEGMEGYCWWSVKSKASKLCHHLPNHTAVSSCPWVGWSRGGGINGSSISFTVSWSLEAPYEVSQDHWQAGDDYHHRFCFCTEADTKRSCDAKCKTPPLPPAGPGPHPSVHYTDPKAKGGCRADEKMMTVGPNDEAAICAPRCEKRGILPGQWSCPTDAPANVTADQGCNFIDDDTNTRFCSLICNHDADCGSAGGRCYVDEFLKMGFCGYPK